jgi:hypothetical protein
VVVADWRGAVAVFHVLDQLLDALPHVVDLVLGETRESLGTELTRIGIPSRITDFYTTREGIR